VTIGWVFFRAESISDAFDYLKLMLSDISFPNELRSAIIYVIMIFVLDLILKNSPKDVLKGLTFNKRMIFNSIIYILIILFYTEGGNFIYFRF
tara:strand:+ start:293 stop:571 length:279 start_codon:yes stop_codon:yes gene_type:complete